MVERVEGGERSPSASSSTCIVDPAGHARRRYRAVAVQVSIDAAAYCSLGVAVAVPVAAAP